jgi:DNA-binding CsgD family transcriptional regulator/predicted DNA-binding transcriptional regulator
MDPVLRKIGLVDQDYAVYEYILRRPGCSTHDVASALGFPQRTVAACRNRLIECGLVRAEAADWLHATAGGPAALAERLRDKLDAEYVEHRTRLDGLRREMTRRMGHSAPVHQPATRLHVDRMTTPAAASLRVTELLAGSRREIVRITLDAADPAGPRSANLSAEVRALRRGVRVRTVHPTAALLDAAGRSELRLRSDEGAEVRIVNNPPVELLVVDRRVAVVDHHRDDSADDSTVIMRGDGLVYPLSALFETWWTIGVGMRTVDSRHRLPGSPPYRPAAVPRDDPAPGAAADAVVADDMILLRLLSEGYKDELVAKHLGLSVRTVRRRISDLMKYLEATSRFQAGLLVARRGWL